MIATDRPEIPYKPFTTSFDAEVRARDLPVLISVQDNSRYVPKDAQIAGWDDRIAAAVCHEKLALQAIELDN